MKASYIGRFYDPLGFLAPVIIPFKVLFQKLCDLQWDEQLPETTAKTWKILIESIDNSCPVSIPRNYRYGSLRKSNTTCCVVSAMPLILLVD